MSVSKIYNAGACRISLRSLMVAPKDGGCGRRRPRSTQDEHRHTFRGIKAKKAQTFEEYWDRHGFTTNPASPACSYKEVAEKAWNAALGVAVISKNGKFSVFDDKAQQIHVGDVLEWQETAGRYGETRRGRGVVIQAELLWGHVVTDGGRVLAHWELHPTDGPEGLYCRHTNDTYEHGHETWARITGVMT